VRRIDSTRQDDSMRDRKPHNDAGRSIAPRARTSSPRINVSATGTLASDSGSSV